MKRWWWMSIFFVVLLAPLALADLAQTLGNVWDSILKIGSLSFLGVTAANAVVAFTRILLGILIFTLLFVGLNLIGKGGSLFSRNQSLVTAGILASISTVFLPAAVILAVGVEWATLVSLILIGAPIAGIMYVFWKVPEHNTRGTYLLKMLGCLILMWILLAMKGNIGNLTHAAPVATSVREFIDYAIIAVGIMALYYFLLWLFGKSKDAQERWEQRGQVWRDLVQDKAERVKNALGGLNQSPNQSPQSNSSGNQNNPSATQTRTQQQKQARQQAATKNVQKKLLTDLLGAVADIQLCIANITDQKIVDKHFKAAKTKMTKASKSHVLEDMTNGTPHNNDAKTLQAAIAAIRRSMDKTLLQVPELRNLNSQIGTSITNIGTLVRQIFS